MATTLNHAEEALRLHDTGANCASSVFAAYRDVTGLNEDAAKRVASSLGGGMGKLGQTCGAFTGMLLALGALYGPIDGQGKKEHYARVRELGERFEKEFGSLACPVLLGEYQSEDPAILPARKAHCNRFLRACCELLDAYIAEHPVT